MSAVEYTIYFAWVPADTPWSLSLARFDENIFDLIIEHDEGQIPQATVEVKNPRIGFINPSRLYWCWISYSRDACEAQPLFYGRLVGIPTEIIANTVRMQFIARDSNYIYQKQQMADLLKVPPNYEPLFLDVAKRGDPDAILEGWSALYHVDRVSGQVSASDILLGEDGTVNFATADVFYDSVQLKLLQSPLVAINVKAEVQWEQQYRGAFYVGQWAFPTLGSDPFIGDWPKSGSSLGGGWYAGVAWAGERDPTIQQQATLDAQQQVQQQSYTFQWTNTAKTHQFGDTMSISINYTPPFGTAKIIQQVQQIGIQNPDNVDMNGDPDPLNLPAKLTIDWFCYRPFALNFLGKQSVATLGLVYEADRKRSERLEMTVTADIQPILIDPTVVEDTEQITLKSGDLSLPLVNMLNWSSVGMGGAVSIGQIIFPDNPLVPGQTSSQIAIQGGNTGLTVPTFSNIAGQTTADGSVVWASLGDTPPAEGAQDWVSLARVSLGTILLPKPVSGVPDFASVQVPGSLNYPPTGTAVPMYSIFCDGAGGPGATMHECTQAGILGGLTTAQAVFRTFTNPTGAFLYIAVQAGTTGQFHTTFNEAVGSQTSDGSVVWQNIGPAELPIGGWPGMTGAAFFFPTDRGQQCVRNMFCRARAKLRKRARAVQLSFDTRFEAAAQLSCRMNGKVSDLRMPGGTVSGKVISYKLEVHGESGEIVGRVVLGCSVGKNAPVVGARIILTDPGVPSYVGVAGLPNGYVKPGYQKYYSSVSGSTAPPDQGVTFPPPPPPPNLPHTPPTLPPAGCPPLASYWSAGPTDPGGNEIAYTPPVSQVNDDGISFPASPGDLILQQAWHGVPSTINPLNIQLFNLELEQIVHDAIAQTKPTKQLPLPPGPIGTPVNTITVPNWYDINISVQKAVIQSLMQGQNLWYELVLKPLHNGPFAGYYVVGTQPMSVLQTINLSAPSTGGLLRA
jgi:hypothetical protein